jgi:tetrahydromethanopterin S-methyltransferase subunit B
MTEISATNLEMAIVLPLGVVAHQLIKIEADLRLLNMKALELAKERENGRHTRLIEATLENINEALDAIKGLVSDIETDIQPKSMNRKTYPERDD